MYPRALLLGAMATLAMLPMNHAANLDRAVLTEVVNRVSIIEPSSKRTSAARPRELFNAPNVLRTGADSRAEMIAPDQTVTRVGQSTLFSFEPNSREIQLQRGSILFQSPSGKGGGNIRTPAASAAVLGTTVIVTTTKNGGFKVLVVEGRGRVKSGGIARMLKGGQMVYALPGGKLSGILEFRLSEQVSAARLIGGFKKPLPSLEKIHVAISKQEKDIASGKAAATNLLASGSPNFAYRIDVARDTLVQDAVDDRGGRLTVAASSDAVIDSRTLDESRVFSDVRLNGEADRGSSTSNYGDDGAIVLRARRPVSFVASNIRFETSELSLAQEGDADLFQFLAINNIDFASSPDFTEFTGRELQLLAGRTVTSESDKVITANVPQFTLLAMGETSGLAGALPERLADLSNEVPLELNNFTIRNRGGNVSVIAGEMKLGRVWFEARDTARLTSASNLIVVGPDAPDGVFATDLEVTERPDALSQIRAGKEARIDGRGEVAIQRALITAPTIRARSERVLRLTTVQLNDGSIAGIPNKIGDFRPPPESTGGVFLYGKELADLRRVNFFANDVLIQSKTVRLEGVRFRAGSRVILESAFGMLADNPNHNAPVQPGKVNFINNVRYGNVPAQQAMVGTTGVSGIEIRKLRD